MSTTPSTPLARVLPHLVAAFLVLHVASSCVDVIPNVGLALNKKAWQEPRVKHELDVWARRLGVERKQFENTLYGLATVLQDARGTLEKPLRPYLTLSGIKQSWAMFIAGTRDRDRFQVRGRSCIPAPPTTLGAALDEDGGCPWQNLYTRGVQEEDLLRPVLEYPRVRSAMFRWGWNTKRRNYEQGCQAIARRVQALRPELAVVQCRFERSVAPGPHDPGPLPAPTWGRDVTVVLTALPPLEAP